MCVDEQVGLTVKVDKVALCCCGDLSKAGEKSGAVEE